MPVPVGSFYINNSNQDFYLKELVNGVPAWVRKGNIRDDGTTGVLTVSPIIAVGFDFNAVVQRYRFLAPASSDLGFALSTAVERIRYLASAMDFGFAALTTLTGELFLGPLTFDVGLAQASLLLTDVRITATMDMGMTETVTPQLWHMLTPSIDMGMTETVLFQVNLAASMAMGVSQASAIEVALSASSMAVGFSMTATLTAPPHSLSLTWASVTPSAVSTTFTYTGGSPAAAEAHLYDGDLTTDAADPAGLTASTMAAYDFGSAQDIRAVALTTGHTVQSTSGHGGFPNACVFDIEYSDTSLTSGFGASIATITAQAGHDMYSQTVFTKFGLHRFWRIIYNSGTTGNDAWMAELGFQVNKGPNLGFGMAVALTLPSVITPTAVNTTFTYTVGAAEANLYDGSLATNAADPAGLTSSTHAAYDFGSAKTITSITVTTGSSSGFANAAVFKLQYSDTSLTAGWTDVTSGSFTIKAGISQATTLGSIVSGSHRYWRIIYVSGTTGGNAWLAELDMTGT